MNSKNTTMSEQSDTPRTDELEGNLIEFCDNQIRFTKMTDHAKTLERELAAARAEIEAANDLAETWKTWERETGVKRDTAVKLYLETVKQRDRLAEALRNCLPFITGDGCGEYSDALEALQMNSKSESKPPVEQPRLVRLSSAALKVWLECEKDTPFFCRRSIDKSCYEVGRQTNEDWRECISEDRIFIGKFATEEKAQAVYDEHRIKWMWEEICRANAAGDQPTV
jgi:hypothetical protein